MCVGVCVCEGVCMVTCHNCQPVEPSVFWCWRTDKHPGLGGFQLQPLSNIQEQKLSIRHTSQECDAHWQTRHSTEVFMYRQ